MSGVVLHALLQPVALLICLFAMAAYSTSVGKYFILGAKFPHYCPHHPAFTAVQFQTRNSMRKYAHIETGWKLPHGR